MGGRVLRDVALAMLAAGLLLAAGFRLGRDVERINALAAQPRQDGGVRVISRAAAAATIDPRPRRAMHEDLRVPGGR